MTIQAAARMAQMDERRRLARVARESMAAPAKHVTLSTYYSAHNMAERAKQQAARQGATAKPAATTAATPYVPDHAHYAANVAAFRELAAKQATQTPATLGAAQFEALHRDPAFIQRLADQETAAAVRRIQINAGLASPASSDEVKRIVANAEAAGVPFDPKKRDA